MEGTPLSDFLSGFNEKTKQIEKLVAAFDRSRQLPSKDALVKQLAESWPCTHRMSPHNLSKLQPKCEDAEIAARLKSNPDFLRATQTNSFHWNIGEVVTGRLCQFHYRKDSN